MRFPGSLSVVGLLLSVAAPTQAEDADVSAWLDRCIAHSADVRREARSAGLPPAESPTKCTTTMLRYCQHAKVPEDCAEDLKATVSRKREALMERILNEQGLDATSEEHRPLIDIMGELDTWRENYARIKNANPLPFWFYDWLDEDQQAEFFAQMTSFDWAIKKSEQLEEAQD